MSKVSGNVQRQRGRAEVVRLDDELVRHLCRNVGIKWTIASLCGVFRGWQRA